MKPRIFFFHTMMMMLALLVMSCASTKNATTNEVDKRDSIRVEVRERIIKVPDTIFVEIPSQSAERVTADSLSHLENDYAVSDAKINADGTLFHSLATKPQQKPVPIEKEIEQKDSVVYVDRWYNETVTKEVEVEKPLSWWQRTQMYGFWVALLIIARKKIFQAILKLFQNK